MVEGEGRGGGGAARDADVGAGVGAGDEGGDEVWFSVGGNIRERNEAEIYTRKKSQDTERGVKCARRTQY